MDLNSVNPQFLPNSLILIEISLVIAFITEMTLSKEKCCKKYNRKGHFGENGDRKVLFSKNTIKRAFLVGISVIFLQIASPNIFYRIS